MKYAQGFIGRIFTIRLEDGDVLPACLERFASEHFVKRGFCIFVGGIKDGSTIVVGPADGEKLPPDPMHHQLSGVQEVVGIGTIFPDTHGNPKLHSHAAFGRKEQTITGCIRPGITAWHIVEIVLIEISGECGIRVKDDKTGFTLLDPEKQ